MQLKPRHVQRLRCRIAIEGSADLWHAQSRGASVKLVHAFLLALTLTPLARSTHAAAAASDSPSSKSHAAKAQAAVDALQQWYVPQSGLYRTTGWWNSANAITALANFSRLARTDAYFPIFANTLHAAPQSKDGGPGFLNNYYDDEGWWALAWIDVYDLTRDPQYLRMADSIFSDMRLGWEPASCGGGIWWSKEKKYKNAIANELFLAVAASLANRETDASRRPADLDWAHKEWSWFLHSGMINGRHLINDGLEISASGICSNNGRETWTYNQGVLLGGLVELDKADHDPNLKKTAVAIALAAITHLTDDQGVLHEPTQNDPGADAPQFKGIFVRNLAILNAASPDRRFRKFLIANATSLWNKDRDASNRFGFFWAGPIDTVDASRQSSALDLLNAAAEPALPADNRNSKQQTQSKPR